MRLLWVAFGALVVWLVYRSLSVMSAAPDSSIADDQAQPAADEVDGVAMPSSKPKATLQQWADSIFAVESGGKGDSLAVRNNNPGNLRDNGNYRVFDSAADGWDALLADLKAKVQKYPNWTLAQIMARYAPASDGNHPDVYAAKVAKDIGVSTTDTLQQIFGTGA